MVLPIVAYGDKVLKQPAREIGEGEKKMVRELVENMFETMYNASGVGLAGPQVNRSLRVFIVDTKHILEKDEDTDEEGIKQAFINPEIVEKEGKEVAYEEGCLSIPTVRENVNRPETVTINYLDTELEEQEAAFDGLTGRVIQHEYDHIEGILFTDHLTALKKRMLKKRLKKIAKGEVDVKYPMRFPLSKKKQQMQ